MTEGLGKFPDKDFEYKVVMSDQENWIPNLYAVTHFANADQFPQDFIDYLTQTPDISHQYTSLMVGTLPGQRYEYYSNPDFEKIKNNVLGELNKIDEALGFYNVWSQPLLLE